MKRMVKTKQQCKIGKNGKYINVSLERQAQEK
jgi:hypothetical protein